MTQNLNNIEESVFQKIQKLLTLSQRGEPGEAEKALVLLKKFLAKYNLTVEDLTNPKEEVKPFSIKYGSAAQKTIIIQCLCNLFGSMSDEFKNCYQYRGGKLEIWVKTTEPKFVLLRDFCDFYLNLYKQDLEKLQQNLLHSFIHKHQLYDIHEEQRKANGGDSKGSKSKMNSLLDWAYMINLQSGLSNAEYQKKVERNTLRLEAI